MKGANRSARCLLGLLAGLASPPTFDLIESEWGMRYLIRTPLDLQGVPSRETGLALRGPPVRAQLQG